MSTQTIIVIISVIILLAIAGRAFRGGPRVTQIDRTVKREKDEREDRGDA